ncbi:MAG: hypothetical protein A2355_14430 [Spirochaetes bacterium RIFOXYB1_FULL_32_8]|nr:MAG: hypothetical protein A2Y30_01445 [Spirochaetes bacterium GWE1_32_154]OHD82013.1 MAG: hypothetical protein A2355_14430 [Spirochaetes bacterium RIFOXYB1_FULL_32_8]
MIHKVVLLTPIGLIITMGLFFRYLSIHFGVDLAILLGFLVYQLMWCIFIPYRILKKNIFFSIFMQNKKIFTRKNTLYIALTLLPIIGAIPLFILSLSKYSIVLLFIGLPFTVFNGVSEEILWRGLFIKTQKKVLLKVIYPAILFSIWHICPHMVYIEKPFVETLAFALFTFPLGLAYSIVANRFDSIKMTSISHAISGIIAFGIPLSTSLSNLLGIPY